MSALVHFHLSLGTDLPPELRSADNRSVPELICNIMFGKPPPRGKEYNAGDESGGNEALAAAVGGATEPGDFEVCSQRMRAAGWDVLV